jgi:hypothetical protein
MAVFEFVEGWYNPHRRHSALDSLSPNQLRKEPPVRRIYRKPSAVHRNGVAPLGSWLVPTTPPADSRAWGTVRYGYPLDGDAEIAGADAGVDVWGLSGHIGLSAY